MTKRGKRDWRRPPPYSEALLNETSSRRRALRLLAGASLRPLVGCSDDKGGSATGAGGTGGGAHGAAGTGGTTGSSTAWASGGTAAMTAKSAYPDPFTAALGSCALLATTTEGP